jgi:hypothetical protein
MSKIEQYREILKTLDSWDSFLLKESRLPGPRANLELAFAVAMEGAESQILRFANLDTGEAPTNTQKEFLSFCGVLGLGYLMTRARRDYFRAIRVKASDPRWRIREAVALGLQKYGQTHMERLLNVMEEWSGGNPLERRAVVATLCEPGLLANRNISGRIIDIIDIVTATILDKRHGNADDFKALRKALGYGWSVVVAAQPSIGKPRMERWIGVQDPDIRWIMKQNLGKKRLIKMDEAWVRNQLEALAK